MYEKSLKKKLVLFSVVLLVISALSMSMVLQAETSEVSTSFLVYERGKAIETLENSEEFSILENYDEFVLVESTITNKDELIRQGHVVETLENRGHIGLQSYSFDTSDGIPDIPERLQIEEYPDDGNGYYIVQFIGPIRSEWKEQLEEIGVTFHEFRHRFNFIVEMDAGTRRRVEGMDYVNWVGIYQPAYRFDRGLLEEDGTLELEVYTFDSAKTLRTANSISEFAEGEMIFIGEDRITVEVDSEDIVELANLDHVKSIELGGFELEFFNDDATWITQTGITVIGR